MLFCFSKENSAVFHGHLSLIEIFSMSLRRALIPVMYTKGFNPLAKLEFASCLSTGISSDMEYAIADFSENFSADDFINNLNLNLPEGITIKNAEIFYIKSGSKKKSLSSLLWGFSYVNNEKLDYVSFNTEKQYRQNRIDEGSKSLFYLRRNEVLAKNIIDDSKEWASYFDVYNHLYSSK